MIRKKETAGEKPKRQHKAKRRHSGDWGGEGCLLGSFWKLLPAVVDEREKHRGANKSYGYGYRGRSGRRAI